VSYLDTAFAESDRMFANCSKAVASNPGGTLTAGTMGLSLNQSKLTKAAEQYRHNVGWVFVAVRAIASRIAGQDIFVGKVGTKPTGKKLILPSHLKSIGDKLAPIENHEFLDALCDPNPLMVRSSLMYSTVASMLLTGRGHWWVSESDKGLQIWPIPSHWIEPGDPMRGTWKLKPTGMEEHELPAEAIIPFAFPDPSNPFGAISPLQSQAAAVSTDEEIQTAQYKAFRNGVNPGLMIRVGKLPGMNGDGQRPVLNDHQRNEITQAILKQYGGTANRQNPLIVDGMIEGVEKLTTSPQEMDFLNSGSQTKARILQAFGVNPLVVGETENSNRASAVVSQANFCETVNPLIQLMSETITRWARGWYGDKLTVWVEPCQVSDPEQKLNEWKTARANGDVTTNEFRANVLNLEPVSGGDIRRDALGNEIEQPAKHTLNGHARI
jgi:HK97 family phage portal protein